MNKDEIFEKLDEYNSKIFGLLIERKRFMDSVMDSVSEFHVGDEYVNVITQEYVKVEKIYRKNNPPFCCYDLETAAKDNSLRVIHACFSNGDNTSHYGETWKHPYIKKKDYEERGEKYIDKLEIVLRCFKNESD